MNKRLLILISGHLTFRPFNTEPVRNVLSHDASKRRPSRATLLVFALLLLLLAASAPRAQQKTTNEAATLIAEARSLWQKGKQFEAIDKIKKAIALDPGSPAAHVELAGMYISVKSNDLARSAVTEALKADPNYAPAHQTMAALLRMARDLEGAIREARLALTLKPDAATEAYAHVTIGRALNRMNRNTEAAGEFDKAVQVYEAVTRKTPADASAYNAMGNLLFDLQRYSEAEAAYRRAVELKPQDLPALLSTGRALHNQGKKDEAVKYYREYLRLDPGAGNRTNLEAQIQWLETAPLSELLGHLLLDAAKNGNSANAKTLLAKGADVNFKANYQTPLSIAAREGFLDVVKLFLAHGARDAEGAAVAGAYAEGHTEIEKLLEQSALQPLGPKAQNRFLYAAIARRDVARFAAALDAGADENKDSLLLYVVSRKGATVEMVQLLLDKGARVDQETRYKTALMHAASEGHTEIVKLLLAKGAAVSAQTDEGTALMMAVTSGNTNIVKLLLSAGADVQAKHRLGDTALIMSARATTRELNPPKGSPPPNPDSESMQVLLAAGADVNARGDWERTALMHANAASKANLLLKHNAEVNARDKDGQTALIKAAARGEAGVVEALLEGGADVNAQDAKGATALLHALQSESTSGDDARRIAKGRLEAARHLLLARTVAVNIQSNDGETALMRAVNLGDTEIVKLLLARAADVNASDVLDRTAFVFAYQKGNAEIEKLLESAAPQQQTPKTVNAFLKAAIAKRDAAQVKEWLAQGADPNYQYPISYSHKEIKSTVLILAANMGNAGIVQMLLDKGADLSAKGLISGSEHGLKFATALEAAEFSKHPEVVLMLKKATATKN